MAITLQCTYLWGAPGQRHLCVRAGVRGVRRQARGVGVLRPPRRSKVADLHQEI